MPDQSVIAINRVGIERFRLPLTFCHLEGHSMTHDVHASMFITLKGGKTGVNMSRFCQILQEESIKSSINNHFFSEVLLRFRTEMRDYDDEELIDESHLSFSFNYPCQQRSLKSDNWGWQYYPIIWEATQNMSETTLKLTLQYEYSSTCPCSLSMAKQYEREFREGKNDDGTGIATAHSQRSLATVTVQYDLSTQFSIEELLVLLRHALPTETQSLVKRVDEQAFAILNGENPMFVEHASRRLSMVLNSDSRILDWTCKVEHFESLHSHNAVAYITKGTST